MKKKLCVQTELQQGICYKNLLKKALTRGGGTAARGT